MGKIMNLDPRLANESTCVTELELCHVRLHHNAAFPWILLIPRREGIVEIIDLSPSDQQLLMQDISCASRVMRHLFCPLKLNVASLGNIVPQLHVHLIARYPHDEAWPGPVWNSGIHIPYDEMTKTERISKLKETFLTY